MPQGTELPVLPLELLDAWNNITFTAGEVKNPRRDVPLSLAIGTSLVMALYLAANAAYFVTLPIGDVQSAPADRVAAATLETVLPGVGGVLMAVGIMISTFGCANALVLTGARAYYAMSRDGLFFPAAGRLNASRVPGWGLAIQGVWAASLVLPRTFDAVSGAYGNLYSSLLDYVVSAALVFSILTIAGVFRLRVTRRVERRRPHLRTRIAGKARSVAPSLRPLQIADQVFEPVVASVLSQ